MTLASDDGVQALIGQLHAAGNLPAACRSALEAVPRAAFIPDRIWVQEDGAEYAAVDRNLERRRWLGNVYSDRVIVTQFDDGENDWPDIGTRPTSSASMPSAVVGMLAELDPRPGELIYEIGTGTGFNAALLGHLVGPTGSVTSVEIDDELATRASGSLARLGVRNVMVECVDAVTSAEPAGRRVWDRVIATAGVHLGRLPYQWVRHTKPGGVLLAPMRADLASGPLVRFVVGPDGVARGRAVRMRVGFMELRSQRVSASISDLRWDDETAEMSTTDLAPWPVLLGEDSRWCVAVAMPSCRYDVWERTADRPGVAWLRDPVSGSWASVVREGASYTVRQSGPRRLWEEAEAAHRWWLDRGSPPVEAWEWTITADRQAVTLPVGGQ